MTDSRVFADHFEIGLFGFAVGSLVGLTTANMDPLPCGSMGQTGCMYSPKLPLAVLSIAVLAIFTIRYMKAIEVSE